MGFMGSRKDGLYQSLLILGWPKGSFRFSHKMLWTVLNELFGQPNITVPRYFLRLKAKCKCKEDE